jgi:hypothetical protein
MHYNIDMKVLKPLFLTLIPLTAILSTSCAKPQIQPLPPPEPTFSEILTHDNSWEVPYDSFDTDYTVFFDIDNFYTEIPLNSVVDLNSIQYYIYYGYPNVEGIVLDSDVTPPSGKT